MMDKKSANGYPSKTPEGGSQRKQIPYSVETPYGFHLDLDFLKYVDDIEKGNTIKRVHIQRKNRGPKYSTLPRNFSLPGHGARPPPKEVWSSGTSTLGPKPKSRVTEVQQIFDFKPSDGGSSNLSRVSQGSSSYSPPPRPAEEVKTRMYEDQSPPSLLVRPNLLRASSMPVNVPRRKGSDSSEERSPVSLGSESQKENGGSYERLFKAADGGDRRGSIPQDRASLHLQITNALKRVRELEEQVRTIPELKSRICSLQEEKEQLLKTVEEQEKKQQKQQQQQPLSVSQAAEEEEEEEEDEEEEEEGEEKEGRMAAESPKRETEDRDLPTTMIFVEPPTPEDETKAKIEESEPTQEETASIVGKQTSTEASEVQGSSSEKEAEAKSAALSETESQRQTSNSTTEQEAETPTTSVQECEEPIKPSRRSLEQHESRTEHPTNHFEEKQIELAEAVAEQATVPRVPLECPVSVVITEAEEVKEETDEEEEEEEEKEEEEEECGEADISDKEETAEQVKRPSEKDSQTLLIQTLQAKLRDLEEQLNLSNQELDDTQTLLREQVEENRLKEKRIQELADRAEELAERAKNDMVDVAVSAESPPQPEPVLTTDASVSTVHVSVSEKAICTDEEEVQPHNGPKETDMACSSTQTPSVEAKDMEVLAKATTSEKEVGVEVATCDQAVETEAQVDIVSSVKEERNERSEEVSEQEKVAPEGVASHTDSKASENVVSHVKVDESEKENVKESVEEDVEAGSKAEEKKVLTEDGGVKERVVPVPESAVTEPTPADSAAVEKTKSEEAAKEPTVAKEAVAVGSPSSSEPSPKPQKEGQPGPAQEAQSQSRRSSSEGSGGSASPAAIGHVVTRIQGLLNEQWSSLGSSGSPATTATAAAATGPESGQVRVAQARVAAPPSSGAPPKQQPSKFSSIQSQLVSSLSVLSSFYSPGQKEKAAAAAASRQSGLKSIMKKDGSPQKPGNGATKKNLKFVGVNGGYESTSSEESSGEEQEHRQEEEEEEEEFSELEELKEEEVEEEEVKGPAPGAVGQDDAVSAGAEEEEKEKAGGPRGPMESEGAEALLSSPKQPVSEVVDKDFMAACYYLKDHRNEVDNPNKEMRQVLMVLYQEWFRVSSQKDSQAETVTLYLREVGNATPTLLSYIINLADGNGNTALHYSVSHSNFPVVRLLLDTELCEVDHQNKAGYTAIMLASLTAAESPEDVEVAQQLLQKGNIDARASQTGQTALMLAVSHGRTAMVRVLLNCGANANVQDYDGSTALMCACEHGHAEIARVLLQNSNCDTCLKDKDGHTAMSVATQASHTELVDILKAHAPTGDQCSPAAAPL
ncbi:KN motif and ankyrin repeat domain-containing protein 4 [Engraulis encrasicolus]|uniref:KN motif and ankyrin repeat domain-containing protein 4 n=1 Tax=Engraulis encrasicolus TaxID=184585 RepID=UPI002FD70848